MDTDRGLKSYISACLNIFGWLSITSGVVIQPGQFIQAVRIFFDPETNAPSWQYFLFFQATNILLLLHNTFLQHRTPWLHDVGCEYKCNARLRALELMPCSSHSLYHVVRGCDCDLPLSNTVLQLI